MKRREIPITIESDSNKVMSETEAAVIDLHLRQMGDAGLRAAQLALESSNQATTSVRRRRGRLRSS